MLFNSIDFAIFLPVFFVFYWHTFSASRKKQNLFILVSSYFFYGYWDYRFLGLIFFSSAVDYFIGNQLERTKDLYYRKILLCLSISSNLSLLAFFKYYNFFIDSFSSAFSFFGGDFDGTSVNVVLPVGISFYTFQTMGYTIDIYKKRILAEKNAVDYFAFVSFFPQLVAGPIERAQDLLPQIKKDRVFSIYAATDGLRLILWGLFMKIVIADNCAIIVNEVYYNYAEVNPALLFIGIVFFSFQVYCDFSGYSYMAIGIAKLIGFNLSTNFKYPFLSRDIAELWRNWHITLTTWFRDYLYIPLGGSRGSMKKTVVNILVIFIVTGFWHGARWNCIFWGAINGLLFIPLLISGKHRSNIDTIPQIKSAYIGLKLFIAISTNFMIWSCALVTFRAESLYTALIYLKRFVIEGIFYGPLYLLDIYYQLCCYPVTFFIIILMISEWFHRNEFHPLVFRSKIGRHKYFRWSIYQLLILSIIYFGQSEQDFFYFKF